MAGSNDCPGLYSKLSDITGCVLKNLYSILLLLFSVSGFASEPAGRIPEEVVVTSSDDTELVVERFTAEGKYLLVMLAPEYGFREAHRDKITPTKEELTFAVEYHTKALRARLRGE